MKRSRGWLIVLLTLDPFASRALTPPPTARPPSYVGREACGGCHPGQSAAWAGSNHDRALQVADASTVRGDFNSARFTYNGITSTFSRKGNDYVVRTDGPDGTLREYRIAYTIGVYPLQQYLIALDDGRLQALSICWDTRPKREGGQRWFHLYPSDKVDFRDVLHWTGPAQNWNFMCAECHSTDVRKGYNAAANRFATRWSEIDVSCEACHGPGSAHVGASRSDPRTAGAGLSVRFPPVSSTDWVFDAGNAIARLARGRDMTQQVEVCGRCHARRSQISEAYRPDQPLSQTHIVSLLDDGLYQADGQILGEVYEYGSFLQSRMFARGVGCTDCHDPHSARLRVEGNGVCATCHQPATYDSVQHHHHGSSAAPQRCVACHMPSRNYMVVHERHDHGFRVPRPDLSVSLGTPNVCTDCHRDRDATWAAAAVTQWYGPTRTRGPAYAPALAAGRTRAAGADRQLAAIITDPTMPGMVRASAVNLLEGVLSARLAPTVEQGLRDLDPLVRRAAVELLPAWDPRQRWALGGRLLQDPIRTVRLAAVNALADASVVVPLSASERAAFEQAAEEYRSVQAFNADRAEAWLNLGALQARLGDLAAAETSYQKAIRLQPMFVAAYVNLADVYRQQERDGDGERVLRDALSRVPDNAAALHALGLLQVRQRRLDDAVAALAKAAEQDTRNPHYAYVYAVALDSVGQPAKALRVLESAQGRFTGDRELLGALTDITARTGDQAASARWGAMLHKLDED